MDDLKWFAIFLVGVAIAGAFAIGMVAFANKDAGVACVQAGHYWDGFNMQCKDKP